MLEDKDRIFTNIYGMFDRSLKGAMARGCWDGTAAIIARGREAIVEEIERDLGGIPPLEIDPGQIHQVVWCTLVNQGSFVQEGHLVAGTGYVSHDMRGKDDDGFASPQIG